MYTFAEIAPDKRFVNNKAWYLKLPKEEIELMFRLHKSVTTKLFLRDGNDPHMFNKAGQPTCEMAVIMNPIALGAKWVMSVECFFGMFDYIFVNAVGGFVPPSGIQVFKEITSGDLLWPGAYVDEKITMSRWEAGTHYYLVSSKGRIFVPEKFDTETEALQHALNFVPRERIEFKQPFREKKIYDGD